MPDYEVLIDDQKKTFRVSNNNREKFLLQYPDAKLAPPPLNLANMRKQLSYFQNNKFEDRMEAYKDKYYNRDDEGKIIDYKEETTRDLTFFEALQQAGKVALGGFVFGGMPADKVDKETGEPIERFKPYDFGEGAAASAIEAPLRELERLSVLDNQINAAVGLLLGNKDIVEPNLFKMQASEERRTKLAEKGFTDVTEAETVQEGGESIISGGLSSLASFGSSAIEMMGGRTPLGIALMSADMISKSIIDYNQQKAASQGKSIEQLIDEKDIDYIEPFSYGLVGSGLEYVGFKGATRKIMEMSPSIKKRIFNAAWASTGEGSTEYTQGALEAINAQVALDKSKTDFDRLNSMTKALEEYYSSKDALEQFFQGAFGGGAINIMRNTSAQDIQYAYALVGNTRTQEEIARLEKNINALAKARAKLAVTKDPTVAEGIRKRIEKLEDKIKFGITQKNGILFTAEKEDYDQVKTMSQLAALQVKKVNELREKIDNGEITDSEYNEAIEGYKEAFLSAKKNILGVAGKVAAKSNKQAAEVNKIYEEEIANETDKEKIKQAEGKILEKYRSMAARIASKRKNAPGFDLDILTNEILSGKRGVIDLLRNYNKYVTKAQKENKPVAPLSGFINNMIGVRAIEASNRVLKKDFDELAENVTKKLAGKTAEQQIENIEKITDKLNLDEKVRKKIVESAKKILGTKLPQLANKRAIKSEIVKALRDDLFKTFKTDVFQVDRSYKDFLSDNFENIFKSIPQATLNKRFSQLFTQKVLDEQGKVVREKTPEGKFVYKRPPITKQQWVDYFTKQPEGVPANSWGKTKSSRKGALAQVLADELGLDQIVQAIADPEIAKRFKEVQELQGEKLEPGFATRLIQAIDRSIEELDKFQRENLLSDAGVTTAVKLMLKGIKKLVKAGTPLIDAIDRAISDLKQGKFEDVNRYETDLLANTFTKQKELITEFINEKNRNKAQKALAKLIKEYENAVETQGINEIENKNGAFQKTIIKEYNDLETEEDKNNYIAEFHRNWFPDLRKGKYNGKTRYLANKPKQGDQNYASKKIKYDNYVNLLKSIFGDDVNTFNADQSGVNLNGKIVKVDASKKRMLWDKKHHVTNAQKNISDFEAVANENSDKNIILAKKLLQGFINQYKAATNETAKQEVLKNAFFTLKLLSSSQRGVIKGMFPFRQHGELLDILNSKKYKNSDFIAEHNPPISWFVENVLMSYITGGIKNFDGLLSITKSYSISFVPKVLNKKIDKAGYKDAMPDNEDGSKFDVFNNPIIRYWKSGIISKPKDEDITYMGFGIRFRKKGDKVVGNTKGTSLSDLFNKLLQNSEGIDWRKRIQKNDAKIAGKQKTQSLFKKFFGIPYQAEDFAGLLYETLGKGKLGEQMMEFYKETLYKPFAEGIRKYEVARQQALLKWGVLKNKVKKFIPKGLKEVYDKESNLTNEHAIRIYIWQKQGMIDIDVADDASVINSLELSQDKIDDAVKLVRSNPGLKQMAKELMDLFPEGYPSPSQGWVGGGIQTDLLSNINGEKRAKFLEEWQQNADEIFSQDNLNKLESLYGEEYVKSLKDALQAMKTGRNRIFGSRLPFEKALTNWITGSVGTIMFLNARSALLQMISSINFLNLSDNNPIAAAAAVANTKQYYKDIAFLYNSDFLKGRRGGLRTDINADDIARAADESGNIVNRLAATVLKKGFVLTQVADSIAIVTGGATFYRNRINSLMKKGMSKKEAENQAFLQFQELTEESQQSSRPDKLSRQQRSSLGRFILNFANTPMQYSRLIKKAVLDLSYGRGDPKTNISKILYYGAVQNAIFTGLQQGLFAMLFDDEEDDEKKLVSNQEKLADGLNGMLNTLLRGTGMYGALGAAGLSILDHIKRKKEIGRGFDDTDMELVGISPSLSAKLRKIRTIERYYSWKQYKEKMNDFSIDNTHLRAAATGLEFFNVPAERILRKMDNIKSSMETEHSIMIRVAFALGWSKWSLNIKDEKPKKPYKKKPRGTRGTKRI